MGGGISRRDLLGVCTVGLALSVLGCGRAQDSERTYFSHRGREIFDEFEALLPPVRRRLAEQFGDTVADQVVEGARARAGTLLPQVPYIGGDANELTRNLYQAAMVLALHLEMKARGRSAAETAEVVYRAFGDHLARMPQSLLLRTAGLAMHIGGPAGEARRSASSCYDWAYADVPGDGEHFEYGVDYTQCGSCAYLAEHGAEDIAPYLCLMDFPMYRGMGVGLQRTKTIARGDGVCDFRYNFDGRYSSEWEPFELGL